MEFSKTVKIANDQSYTLNDDVKVYLLRDTGFVEKPNGWLLLRSLQPNVFLDQAISLKILVNKDLQSMKMEIVGPSGLAIDLDRRDDWLDLLDQLHEITSDLQKRKVLTIS